MSPTSFLPHVHCTLATVPLLGTGHGFPTGGASDRQEEEEEEEEKEIKSLRQTGPCADLSAGRSARSILTELASCGRRLLRTRRGVPTGPLTDLHFCESVDSCVTALASCITDMTPLADLSCRVCARRDCRYALVVYDDFIFAS